MRGVMCKVESTAVREPRHVECTATRRMEPDDADTLIAGTRAGPWRIECELGRGGMGAVYGVIHHQINKRAALKVMHRRVQLRDLSDINYEARVANAVAHPSIVDVFETGVLPDGRPYIVMERLDGESLYARTQHGEVASLHAIEILLRVCEALRATHAAGIVHRDLKPENVFLVAPDDLGDAVRVKLLDWGIAKVMCSAYDRRIDEVIGTPTYLSPEQAAGYAVSPKSDIYSLGVMAFELFLGRTPFEGESSELIAMHRHAVPPAPHLLWNAIPPMLEQLLLAMLAKDPDRRPTLQEIAITLAHTRHALELATPRSLTLARASAAITAMTTAVTQRRAGMRWRTAAWVLASAVLAAVLSLTHTRG